MANKDQNFEKFILPHADLQPAALLAVEDPLPVYFKEYLEGGNVKTPSYTPKSVNTCRCSGFWRRICAEHLYKPHACRLRSARVSMLPVVWQQWRACLRASLAHCLGKAPGKVLGHGS